jgi:hypothetical protein
MKPTFDAPVPLRNATSTYRTWSAVTSDNEYCCGARNGARFLAVRSVEARPTSAVYRVPGQRRSTPNDYTSGELPGRKADGRRSVLRHARLSSKAAEKNRQCGRSTVIR